MEQNEKFARFKEKTWLPKPRDRAISENLCEIIALKKIIYLVL